MAPVLTTEAAMALAKRLPAAEQREALRLMGDGRPGRKLVWAPHYPTLQSYAAKVAPRFTWHQHCDIIGRVVDRVISGELRRVLIFCPPRHGKTEQISRLAAACYLHRHPERWVGLASYGAELAYRNSRAARAYFEAGGRKLRGNTAAVREWETGLGGGLWADGYGGALTGKGYHLGIVDDPVKNAAEAASETVQATHRDWWRSTWYTREEPGGAIVLVMTPWHMRDVGQWLLSEEAGGEEAKPERWHVVCLPAIAEAPEIIRSHFPATCTIELDWRQPGEPLCPDRYPLRKLERIRARIGSYYWTALYQQRPTAPEGSKFRRSWFEVVDKVPEGTASWCRAWDKAATQGAGHYTAGVLMARTGDIYYIVDVHRGQWSEGTRDREIRRAAEADGRSTVVRGPQDPGAAGKSDAGAFVRLLTGYTVRTKPVTGSKELRAGPLAAQAEAGNVKLIRGEWNRAFLDELTAFPTGANDDQVDAAADAFDELSRSVGIRMY